MASIRKRGNTYQIRVSCGYNTSGDQVVQIQNWTPDAGMTQKQIEKELNRRAVEFENACKFGFQSTVIKFQDFAEQWFREYAPAKLKTQTIRSYHTCESKVYKAIGHLRMDKITTRLLQQFVMDVANEKRFNRKGEPMPPYAPKTVRNYITFISTVFDYAVRMQMLSDNPCRNVVIPSIRSTKRDIYTLEEVQQMLDLFEQETEANYKYTIFFTLAAFTGLRRGELLGLEWKDIDWKHNMLSVVRTSEYTKEKGIYTDTPKTESSQRVLKLPDELMQKLKAFQEWQNGCKRELGSKWIECDRLFTKTDGSPMGMRQPYKFFERFCKKTGMRFVNIHSFRHFNASILISNGVDVKTVQGCLGHSSATTTLNIYAHSFQAAQVRAMDSVADCILKRDTKSSA